MGDKIILILVLLLAVKGNYIHASGDKLISSELEKSSSINTIQKAVNEENYQIEDMYSKEYTENLSRVKRQYSYGRDRYYPLPIIVGGFGYPAFGPRGYGGRGFGGRGFAARGVGGRGFGGRGIGGRGIGGRGGIGGGRGGRG